MKSFKLCWSLGLIACGLAVTSLGQQYQMPQDNWTFGDFHINGSFGSIAIGPDGNLYAATGGGISIYDRSGALLDQRGTNLNVHGIGLDSATNLYVLDGNGTNVVLKFSVAGNLIRSFGTRGMNDDQVIPASGPPSALTVGLNNQVYVLDGGNRRIQVYDGEGNHLFHWGDYAGDTGNILGRFSNLEAIAAMPNGDIVVRNGWDCCGSSGLGNFNRKSELQLFTSSGSPIAIKSLGQAASNEQRVSRVLASTSDGLVAVGRSHNTLGTLIDFVSVFPGDTTTWSALSTLSTASLRPDRSAISEALSIAFDQFGEMYVSYYPARGLHSARRVFKNGQYETNAPPLPYILSVNQRADSSLVDIDYRVISKPGSNVIAALLVFINNGNDFTSLRVPHFVEGTATNVGTSRPANAVQRVTWDASELATNFVNVQFEALAKDGRGLMPLSFVTLPNFQEQSKVTLTRSGILDSDLLPVWYWLLATNHPAITLTNGEVRAVGTGEQLASGSSTTASGRNFLYQLMGLRRPTAEELQRASAGNYGFVSVGPENAAKD